MMLRQKHRRVRRDHARFATKGLRPQLSRSDPSSRLLQIVEESKEVEICVGLVDAAHVKAARNNFKRLAAAGEDDCRRRTLASPPHFVAERGSGMSSKAAKAQQHL